VVLVAFTILPVITGLFGGVYLAAAVVLGAGFLLGATRLLRDPSRRAALRLYLGSLAYLFLLFGAMAADRLLAV
jgi:protoheme IX farnesyltransferase